MNMMTLKRFLVLLFTVAVFFIAGVAVGWFLMPRQIHITVVNIKDLVDIIERYNESKHELEKIKLWNENAIIPEPEPKKEEK